MEYKDIVFTPHSDVGAYDLEIVEQHKKLINENKYDDATALLNSEEFGKGVRASLLNSIQNKLRMLQLYFLNEFVANKDDYYSIDEPTDEFMETNGYKFWIKIY